ncbi:hypothetical protein ACU8V7_16880 [Zobellia nedashkovskayae]
MAEATIAYTTVVNGEKLSQEKTFKGTQSDVKSQLMAFEESVELNKGKDTEITVEKVDIRK